MPCEDHHPVCTLWIYDDHFEEIQAAEAMAEVLSGLDLPEPDKSEASRRMEIQFQNAPEWRDVINTFFHRLSGAADEKGRRINKLHRNLFH